MGTARPRERPCYRYRSRYAGPKSIAYWSQGQYANRTARTIRRLLQGVPGTVVNCPSSTVPELVGNEDGDGRVRSHVDFLEGTPVPVQRKCRPDAQTAGTVATSQVSATFGIATLAVIEEALKRH